jgi:predicted P-loop ATPase
MNNSNSKPTEPTLHEQEWKDSAVSDAIIAANVWTITDSREVDKLLNRNVNQRWAHSADLVPGWAVAGVEPATGERTLKGAQYKPAKPQTDPKTGKTRKYLSPAKIALSPLFLAMPDADYWSNVLGDRSQPILITEGAKKAGAALSAGFAAISLPGVSTGGKLGRLRPELANFCIYGRRVYLAFDMDLHSKKAVQIALQSLARMIRATGATVYILEWPEKYKGLDDWIASGGQLQPTIENAQTIEEWFEARQQTDSEPVEQQLCRLADRFQRVEQQFKGRIRWNELKSEVEFDGERIDVEELRLVLALRFNIDIPRDDCKQIFLYLAQRAKYRPVVDYLRQCADTYEADSELLDSLASRFLGAEGPLYAAFVRKTLISAVARALSPGCKVDTVCILSGAQGAGKSSFWRILAGDWFDDSIGNVSDKDERLKLHQAWIVEWAELETVFRRRDVSAVKALITTQRDHIRPPYGQTVKEFARPSIFVGTTNHDEFLADPSGNRRFWVLPVGVEIIDLELLASERDRIWAAATHAYLGGEGWQLPAELREDAKIAGRDYEVSDPWEEPVLNFLQQVDRITIDRLLADAVGVDIDKQDKAAQFRITSILKANQWTTSRDYVDGRRRRFWNSPTFKDLAWPACPIEAETQSAVKGQANGTTPGQPPGQPPQTAQNLQTELKRDKVDKLDQQKTFFSENPQIQTSEKSPLNPVCESVSGASQSVIEIGDTCEILEGRFRGCPAVVEEIFGTHAKVRKAGWVIQRSYALTSLKLVLKRV